MAKCRALSEEGITAYHWAGSYRVPPATVTGSIQQDMCFIESCIGVGEIAVSDHRSSCPTPHELARIARSGALLDTLQQLQLHASSAFQSVLYRTQGTCLLSWDGMHAC